MTTANETILQRAEMLGLQRGTPEFAEFIRNGGRPVDGLSLEMGPDGTVRMVQGPGVTGGLGQGVSDPLNPTPTMLEDIGRAREIAERNPLLTTGAGSLLSGLPGTDARDLRALLDSVRANIGFAALQRMRDNSPTGGALGQVTERELAFLQATLGNLEQSQSTGQFLETLTRLEAQINEVVHGNPQSSPGQMTDNDPLGIRR